MKMPAYDTTQHVRSMFHGSDQGKMVAIAFGVLMLLISLPSGFRYILATSSLTPGMLTACGIIILAGLAGFYRVEGGRYWILTLVSAAIIGLSVTVQGLVASLMVEGDVVRAAGSLAVVIVMMITAYMIRLVLQQTPSGMLDRVMRWISWTFLLIALFSIVGLQPLASELGKPIFPFAEPSHFALSFTPFMIYQAVRSSLPARMAWLGLFLALALLLESLSLVLATAVAAACSLSLPLLSLGLVIVIAAVGYVDISYFTDRLDFSVHTTNLSTLVYIQGVELIDTALRKTWGWGVGFQQLGIVPLNTPTSDLIYRLINDDANLRDGGFTAAKMISEMGAMGVGFVLAYIYVLIRAGLALRQLSYNRAGTAHELFALAAIAAPSIELFVRGIGYFSGTLLLMGAALMMAMEGGYLSGRRSVEDQVPT